MVLSFTIFITVIIFAYTFIGSPFKISTTKADSLDLLKVNLLNELEQDVIVARVYDTANPCIQFTTPSNSFSNIDIISTQSNGDEVDSVISGADTLVSGSKGFVKVYYAEGGFSQALNSPGAGCVAVEPKSISHEKIIMEQTILDTIDRLGDDYTNLTKDLRVSGDDEINILFEYSGNKVGVETRDVKTDIYARKYEINFLSKNGTIETGGLIVNLW